MLSLYLRVIIRDVFHFASGTNALSLRIQRKAVFIDLAQWRTPLKDPKSGRTCSLLSPVCFVIINFRNISASARRTASARRRPSSCHTTTGATCIRRRRDTSSFGGSCLGKKIIERATSAPNVLVFYQMPSHLGSRESGARGKESSRE